jgi:23S rRNA pseudouridine2605 synthase
MQMERLQKIIAAAGVASRRDAEQLIAAGRVSVNGDVVTILGTQVGPDDLIAVDGEILTREEKVYYLLNKPSGVVSTTDDDKKRRTVVDLIAAKERIFPIGRLDFDTTGVLLLTNDGDFNNALIHPRFHVEKEYRVKVDGLVRRETSTALCRGILVDGRKTSPAKIFDVRYDEGRTSTWLSIVVTEGRYHQIKKMFATMGHDVLKLRRERFGTVTCEGLAPGGWRRLKPHEIRQLWNLSRYGRTDA